MGCFITYFWSLVTFRNKLYCMRMGINGFLNYFLSFTGPILESKGMHAIFQKMGKIFETLGKNDKI